MSTYVCLGSGPSLTEADCSYVQGSGAFSIAVNSTIDAAPWANAVYAMDSAWWRANFRKAMTFCGAKFSSRTIPGVKKVWINAGNSGAGAIRLAIQMGAKKVVLLGYDCSVKNGSHWHGDHEITKNPDPAKCEKWQEHFQELAKDAADRGVEVVNCSRETDLRAFRRGVLEEELGQQPGAIYVKGMHGLGDNIFQRGFIKNLKGDIYVETPWPQLYEGLDVKCVKPKLKLRTQAKNAEAVDTWAKRPAQVTRYISPGYNARTMERASLIGAMRGQFGVEPDLSLPDFPSPVTRAKYAVIRPATVRTEWANPARNPDPRYLAQAAEMLRQRGYYVVSVADINDTDEWAVGELPYADLRMHGGEWDVTQILGLVQHASVVVGGVGWILPAAAAYETPLYMVLGGNLGHNAPEKIGLQDAPNIGWAVPVNPCYCASKSHDCEKVIHEFSENFSDWLAGRNL